ncbi:MAG: sialidase family protein [Aeoliella sp.]
MNSFTRQLLFVFGCLSSLLTVAHGAEFTVPPVAQPGTGAYLAGELIYELGGWPTPRCHASTIVETRSGLVAAWFGGTDEGDSDVGIWVSRQEGQKWLPPLEVADGSEGSDVDFPCWNPVLFRPTAGPLLLFYKVGPSPSEWWGMLVTSQDGGRTWSAPRKLGTDRSLGVGNSNLIGPVKNKPVQLADGAIICPSSTEHRDWRIHFELTKDSGITWEVVGPISDASNFDAIQPTLLRHGDRGMQVLCRTKQGVIAQSWSRDGGKTWSKLAATELPNPDAGADAVTLEDGRQLLVYNHAVKTKDQNGRQMLNVAISHDGESWQPVLTLENEGNSAGYSYPAVIQASNEKVHITYTWRRLAIKHVVLDPAALH